MRGMKRPVLAIGSAAALLLPLQGSWAQGSVANPAHAGTEAALTDIYGAEDWQAMRKGAAEDAQAEAEDRAGAAMLMAQS